MANERNSHGHSSDGANRSDDSTRDLVSRGSPVAPIPPASSSEVRFEPSRRRDSLGRLGTYEVLEYLGRGGMGMVWKATDETLRRPVAIKLMLPELRDNYSARQRFHREAQAAAAVKHPNVVTIHAVSEHGGTPFLAMEFVEGGTLKDRLESEETLGLIDAVDCGLQVANGLAAIHERGVVHRDLKPSNVLVEKGRGTYKIGDFGLARIGEEPSDLSMSGATLGTTTYMSPEQLLGKSLDPRSDLFSLGSLLYQLVTGEAPFRGATSAVTAHNIVAMPHRPLSDVRPNVPSALSSLIDRLLAKAPEDRYASADETAEALRTVLDALREPLPEQPLVPKRTNREFSVTGRYAAFVALPLAIIAVPALLWLVWSLKEPPEYIAPHGSGVPETQKLARIIVGPDADCPTIQEALAKAQPGAEIIVLGPGPYTDAISLLGPEHRGIRLRAEPRAEWRSPEGAGRCIFAVHDVHDLEVSGFDFTVGHTTSRAMQITGDTRNLLIEDCSFSHGLANQKLSLILVATEPKDEDSVVKFDACEFSSTPGSMMCLSLGSENSSTRMECWHSRFTGTATLVYATDSCRRLSLRHNVFIRGKNAINLDFREWHADSRVEVLNNTFVESQHWIGLMDSFKADSKPQGRTDSIVANNLILGGDRVQGSSDQWDTAIAAWTFDANWWKPDASTHRSGASALVASFHDEVGLSNTSDPQSPDFLVPAAGSPLLTSGVGGDLPLYIGATGPVPLKSEGTTPDGIAASPDPD